MKQQTSLSIQSPCTEKWGNFKETSTGGFCQSCEKNVIDFSQMSDLEMINYWKTADQRICGRFNANQLKTYHIFDTEPSNQRYKWLKAAAASLILFLSNNSDLKAQESLVSETSIEYNESSVDDSNSTKSSSVFRGIVKDEHSNTLPGVAVFLEGSTIGTTTDLDGEFEFPQELKKGDVLIYSFIGYAPVKYVVKEEQNIEFQFTEINFKSCDMVLMGEVSFDHVYQPKTSVLERAWNKVVSVF